MSSSSSKMGTPLLAQTLLLLLSFPSSPAATNTLVLDDLANRRTATLQIGDSLLFKRTFLQNLHLFHNRRAFDLCNFADASSIYHDKSTQFKWTPPQSGRYYFSTKDGSEQSCEKGDKLLVRVIIPELISPALSPEVAPPPTSGGDLPSSPSRGWWASGGLTPPPSLAPEANPPEQREGIPSAAPPPEAGEGMPFINSNPAIPVPTGETNTAVLRPLPNPSEGASQVVGQSASLEIQMLLVFVLTIMSSALRFVSWI